MGGVDAAFAFPLTSAIRSFDKTMIVSAIDRLDHAIPAGKHELVFVENHDMSRIASDPGMTPEKLRTAATLMIGLKGVPSIYYGQELGMKGGPRGEYKSDEKDIGDREAFKWNRVSEAPGEAIWYKGTNSYWTERFENDNDGVSVEEEEGDPSSLLNHYRRLLAIRAKHPALRSSQQRVLGAPGPILAVERSDGHDHLLILANLSPHPADYRVSGKDLLTGKPVYQRLQLAPFEATIVQR